MSKSLLMYWVLNGLDLLATFRFLKLSYEEFNPIANLALRNNGLGGLTAWKLLMVCGVSLIAVYVPKKHPDLAGMIARLLFFGNCVYALAVVYNLWI